jgi:cell division transport system ATP-binding protein
MMISLDKVSKQFRTGVFALSNVSFDVEKGEFVFLVGPTGSGKTTIFRLITRETLPTSGEIIVDNWDVVKLPHNKISHLRKKIGVVYQDLKLLMDRTIFENVILPLDVSGINSVAASKIVEEMLKKVGILSHKDKFPIQLSGGELQRVAIARALTLEPEILLADEPTGNLDSQAAMEIVNLLSEINKKGTTVIMATHNEDAIKALAKRVICLNNGVLMGENGKKIKTPEEHLEEKSAIINNENKKAGEKQEAGDKKDSPEESGVKKKDEDF